MSGAPDLYLQSITVDLSPTDLRFDTAPGGVGSLASQNVCCYSGTDTTTGLTGESGLVDGGQQVTFNFSDFLPGDNFQFTLDVDHPNPVLTTPKNCSTLKGLALLACNATNAGIAAANDAVLLAAQTVLTNAMSNSLVTYQFGGSGYITGDVTGNFGSLTLQDIINGQTASTNDIQGDVQTPEPGTIGLIGVALVWLGTFRRRRRRSASAPIIY